MMMLHGIILSLTGPNKIETPITNQPLDKMNTLKIGDQIRVIGYTQIHTITSVNSAGYSTKYMDSYNGKSVEMTLSHVPFSFVT